MALHQHYTCVILKARVLSIVDGWHSTTLTHCLTKKSCKAVSVKVRKYWLSVCWLKTFSPLACTTACHVAIGGIFITRQTPSIQGSLLDKRFIRRSKMSSICLCLTDYNNPFESQVIKFFRIFQLYLYL